MTKIRCVDGIRRKDTPAQAEIRKTKPWAQARPERFRFDGVPYGRGRHKGKVRERVQNAVFAAARGVGLRRLLQLQQTVQARAAFKQQLAAPIGAGAARREFLHAEAERKAAQHELDMIERAGAAAPDLDDDLVACMLELNQTNPQLFPGFFGKSLSMQTPEQNSPRDDPPFRVQTVDELLAEYQRLGVPPPDRLKEEAAKQAAAKEQAQKAAR
jgi:hypothetical protein